MVHSRVEQGFKLEVVYETSSFINDDFLSRVGMAFSAVCKGETFDCKLTDDYTVTGIVLDKSIEELTLLTILFSQCFAFEYMEYHNRRYFYSKGELKIVNTILHETVDVRTITLDKLVVKSPELSRIIDDMPMEFRFSEVYDECGIIEGRILDLDLAVSVIICTSIHKGDAEVTYEITASEKGKTKTMNTKKRFTNITVGSGKPIEVNRAGYTKFVLCVEKEDKNVEREEFLIALVSKMFQCPGIVTPNTIGNKTTLTFTTNLANIDMFEILTLITLLESTYSIHYAEYNNVTYEPMYDPERSMVSIVASLTPIYLVKMSAPKLDEIIVLSNNELNDIGDLFGGKGVRHILVLNGIHQYSTKIDGDTNMVLHICQRLLFENVSVQLLSENKVVQL